MKVFHYENAEAIDAEEGASKLKVRWLITKETGAENFVMRLFEMEPEGHSPFHAHPWEHEVFILDGKGYVVSEDGEVRFRSGDVIFVPPNEKHQFKNDGAESLRFLCLIPILAV
jgi:quercetin dioxygenase-like cupin family protein